MIKLPPDKYGNEGWAVKARKPHKCEGYRHDGGHISAGDFYYRGVCWPGDVNTSNEPWVIKLCRDCLQEEMQCAFDAIVTTQTPLIVHQCDSHALTAQTGTNTSPHIPTVSQGVAASKKG